MLENDAAAQFDAAAKVTSMMKTSLKLPPLGSPVREECRLLDEDRAAAPPPVDRATHAAAKGHGVSLAEPDPYARDEEAVA